MSVCEIKTSFVTFILRKKTTDGIKFYVILPQIKSSSRFKFNFTLFFTVFKRGKATKLDVTDLICTFGFLSSHSEEEIKNTLETGKG